MQIGLEMAILSIWIFDEKNEVSKLSDLNEDLFTDKVIFNKIKLYKESGHPYDTLLMSSILGTDLTKQITETIGLIGTIQAYRSYLDQLKKLRIKQNINDALLSDNITVDILQQQIKLLQDNSLYEKPVFDLKKDYGKYIDEIKRRLKGDYERYNTGIQELDDKLGYLLPGYLVVIGGLHGTGKTNFNVKIMDNLTNATKPCLYVSSEMSPESLLDRIVSQQIDGLSTMQLKDGYIGSRLDEIDKVIKKLSIKPINILETGIFNMEKISRYIDDIKPKVMFIDFIQMFCLEISYGDNRASAMSEIARQLKALAVDKNIVVIALSQVNAEGQMKESRGIEEKADVVMRLEDEEKDTNDSKLIKLIITKNRYGETNKMYFRFSKIDCSFEITKECLSEYKEETSDWVTEKYK